MAAGPLRTAFGLLGLPLRHGLGQKDQRHAPQGDGVPQLHGGRGLHPLSVHLGAALGAQVVQGPLLALAPAEGRVLAGDAGIVQIDVRGLAAAQDILPSGSGAARCRWAGSAGPSSPACGGSAAGTDRPVQDQNGQRRNRNRTKAIYHSPARGYAASSPVRAVQQCLYRHEQRLMALRLLSRLSCDLGHYSILRGKCTDLRRAGPVFPGAGCVRFSLPDVCFFRKFFHGLFSVCS